MPSDTLIEQTPHAGLLREKLNTLFNHDGKSMGKFVVGNYAAQGVGAFIGYHTGRIAKANWEEKYNAEKKKLSTVDRFLV